MATFFDAGYVPGRRTAPWHGWPYLVLGVWLFVSPWVLGFGHATPVQPDPVFSGDVAQLNSPEGTLAAAVWNAWVLGGVLLLIGIAALAHAPIWPDHIAIVLGAWVFAAPWVLGFSGWWPAASWDHWMTGLLVFIAAAFCLPGSRVRY